MKVFLAVASLLPKYGGPAYSVSQLAVALARSGVEVGLWAPDGSAPVTELLASDTPVRRLDGTAAEALARFGRPDVVHDNGIWWAHNHALAGLARRMGVPRLVSTRGMLEPWAVRHKGLKKKLAWLAYQRRDLARAGGLHATAEAEAANLAALSLGLAIATIPNGVDLPAERPARDPARDGRTALFMGRIYPVKGLPMLVEAWAAARPAGWRLEIAGPDEAGHRAEVEAAVRAAGLTEAVGFLGPLGGADKEAAFRRADLFVLPSHSESFGMAVGEALAHGLPVLTTRAVPWPGLETDRCGWRVETSAAGLAEGLRLAAATEPAELHAMGARGRALIGADFSWDRAADRFGAVYRALRDGR